MEITILSKLARLFYKPEIFTKGMETVQLKYKKFFIEEKKQANFYRECIELADSIMQDIIKKRGEIFRRTRERANGPESIVLFFQLDILQQFFAHYILLEKGLLLASFSNIRAIYEYLLRIYLIKTDRELGELNHKYETRKNKKYSEEERKEIEKEFKKHGSFSRWYVEKKIYSEEKIKKFRLHSSGKHFYELISERVHPSIQSRGRILDGKKDIFTDSIQTGIRLTAANFVLICENYKELIKEENKKKIHEVVKKYPEFIGEYPDFYPDINSDKLHFGTHQKFLDYLRGNSD